MALLKKLFLIACVLIMLILGVWFSTENTQQITLLVLGYELPALTSGVLIPAVLLLGALLGFLVGLLPVLSLKNRNRSLTRKLSRRDRELEHLRRAPLKE